MNEYRNKILELFDEGTFGKDELFVNLINFISESDAKEFYEQYLFHDFDEDEDDDYEDDDQPRWATKLVPGIARF